MRIFSAIRMVTVILLAGKIDDTRNNHIKQIMKSHKVTYYIVLSFVGHDFIWNYKILHVPMT